MNTDTNAVSSNLKATADALEAEYLAVANGQKKPAKIALEPMVRAVQLLRALAPTPSAHEEAVRVPEGYALVPLKPTAEIVQAGGEARIADFNRNGTTLSVRDANRVAEAMYRAMIAAAPAASAGDQS